MKIKLRTKLAVSYALLFMALLALSGVAVYRLMEVRLTADADDNLLDHLAGVWGYIEFHDGRPALVYDKDDLNQRYFLREATRYYQIYDMANGALVLESEYSRELQEALDPDQVRALALHPGINTTKSQNVPVRFRSAVFHANGHAYLLRVGVLVEHELSDLADLQRVLLSLLPAATLIAVLAAWWMAGQGLRPVRDLEREARAISISELGRRLSDRGTGDELDSLANTFNRVLARLESSVGQMRNFADFMAHELRTPMTVLRGEAEVQLMRSDLSPEWRSHLESHIEEVDKLNSLINRFLLLAKAETGALKLEKHYVDLTRAASSAAKSLEPVARSIGVALTVDTAERVEVFADPQWLEEAILNLLDNALKFTPIGGQVRIVTRNEPDRAVVEISDTGRGISATDLPHIFEHSYRARDAEPQHRTPGGLGLALTKWIVDQHLGTIQVTSIPGEGSRFCVILPRMSNLQPDVRANSANSI
jgi:heavy metal sensor kinase